MRNTSAPSYSAGGRLADYQTTFRNPSPLSLISTSSEVELVPDILSSEINVANSGDHPLILQYLRSASAQVTENEFEHSLDHPYYAAKQRFLIRRNNEIIGHARAIPRELSFGSLSLLTTEMTEFVVLPEYSGVGSSAALMNRAIQSATHADVTMLTAAAPPFQAAFDWAEIETGHDFILSPRDLLSAMQTVFLSESISPNWQSRYEVRPYRWIERYDMMAIYDRVRSTCQGTTVRSDEYWHWLSSRHGYDRAYVVVENSGAEDEKIVGYTFLRNDKLLELAVVSQHDDAVYAILRRIALEAVEKGGHSLTLKASSFFGNETVEKILRTSCANLYRSRFCCHIVSMVRLLKSLSPEIFKCARKEGLSTGTKIGFCCGEEEFTIEVLRQKIRVSKGIDARSCLHLPRHLMTKLIFGDLDLVEEVQAGNVESSTQVAKAIAVKLFPQRRHFRLPLDDQLALK